MARYAEGEATQFAYGEIFHYNFEEVSLPGKDYFDTLDEYSLFTEAVRNRATALGYKEETDLVSFLLQLCKEVGVVLSRQTLSNWLLNGSPANSESGRENIYKLCFALKMNAVQTGEFFLKAYLERPFNYKNLHEAVYFFCMNNDLGYTEALRLIEQAEAMPIIEKPDVQEITEEIGRTLQTFRSEEVLLRYLQENRSGFAVQNQTATKRIADLITSCCNLAEKEFAILNQLEDKPKSITNEDELLAVIYGYHARETSGYWEKNRKNVPKPVYAKSISESRFPRLVRCNFPQRQQLENIKKHKASYDAIRKSLILLSFYHFFADARIKGIQSADLFDEFVDEMNTTLAQCGYVQLYWRNPFDWMFGHCAEKEEPLDVLRDFIDEYYLSDPSIYNP